MRSVEATSRPNRGLSLVRKAAVVGNATEKRYAAVSAAWRLSVKEFGGAAFALVLWGGLLGETLAPPLTSPGGEGGGIGDNLATGGCL